ncbi:hypothetical protein [Alteromonas sp. CYL-A6]|uniref:hypothetical protein n=1 Tax=Alteromonas nitratireducens TaxID=3390813 RepID=UPI0034C1D06B
MRYVLGALCWFISFAGHTSHPPVNIVAGTYQDHIPEIAGFVERYGCQHPDVANFGENQILAEYLIFCTALSLSERQYTIRLLGFPINTRLVDGINDNLADISAVGIWKDEAERQGTETSAPLFRSGEFIKGLYTTKANLDRFSNTESLDNAVVLANQNWTFDWEMLNCTSLRAIHVDQYENMFRMLLAGRGDVIPLTFSNRIDLKRDQFGIALYPVAGVKLVFPGTTHFVVSNRTPRSKMLLEDVNTGLRQLRENGVIERVYARLGITTSRVSDWQHIGQCSS